MASIVKANASLTAGGIAVIRRQYSTTDDGTCNYEAEYCCLARFANNYIGRFRSGANPITSIPASMSSLRLQGVPKLYDMVTRTERGLTYFSAKYSAASNAPGEVIITESTEQRSFSATVQGSIRTAGNFGSTATVNGSVGLAFDYMSKTVRVEAKNPRILQRAEGDVGLPFNISIGQISGVTPLVSGTYRKATIESTSTTRSSRGIYTYSKSSSGIYEVVASRLF